MRKGENYGFIQPGDSGAEEKESLRHLKKLGLRPPDRKLVE